MNLLANIALFFILIKSITPLSYTLFPNETIQIDLYRSLHLSSLTTILTTPEPLLKTNISPRTAEIPLNTPNKTDFTLSLYSEFYKVLFLLNKNNSLLMYQSEDSLKEPLQLLYSLQFPIELEPLELIDLKAPQFLLMRSQIIIHFRTIDGDSQLSFLNYSTTKFSLYENRIIKGPFKCAKPTLIVNHKALMLFCGGFIRVFHIESNNNTMETCLDGVEEVFSYSCSKFHWKCSLSSKFLLVFKNSIKRVSLHNNSIFTFDDFKFNFNLKRENGLKNVFYFPLKKELVLLNYKNFSLQIYKDNYDEFILNGTLTFEKKDLINSKNLNIFNFQDGLYIVINKKCTKEIPIQTSFYLYRRNPYNFELFLNKTLQTENLYPFGNFQNIFFENDTLKFLTINPSFIFSFQSSGLLKQSLNTTLQLDSIILDLKIIPLDSQSFIFKGEKIMNFTVQTHMVFPLQIESRIVGNLIEFEKISAQGKEYTIKLLWKKKGFLEVGNRLPSDFVKSEGFFWVDEKFLLVSKLKNGDCGIQECLYQSLSYDFNRSELGCGEYKQLIKGENITNSLYKNENSSLAIKENFSKAIKEKTSMILHPESFLQYDKIIKDIPFKRSPLTKMLITPTGIHLLLYRNGSLIFESGFLPNINNIKDFYVDLKSNNFDNESPLLLLTYSFDIILLFYQKSPPSLFLYFNNLTDLLIPISITRPLFTNALLSVNDKNGNIEIIAFNINKSLWFMSFDKINQKISLNQVLSTDNMIQSNEILHFLLIIQNRNLILFYENLSLIEEYRYSSNPFPGSSPYTYYRQYPLYGAVFPVVWMADISFNGFLYVLIEKNLSMNVFVYDVMGNNGGLLVGELLEEDIGKDLELNFVLGTNTLNKKDLLVVYGRNFSMFIAFDNKILVQLFRNLQKLMASYNKTDYNSFSSDFLSYISVDLTLKGDNDPSISFLFPQDSSPINFSYLITVKEPVLFVPKTKILCIDNNFHGNAFLHQILNKSTNQSIKIFNDMAFIKDTIFYEIDCKDFTDVFWTDNGLLGLKDNVLYGFTIAYQVLFTSFIMKDVLIKEVFKTKEGCFLLVKEEQSLLLIRINGSIVSKSLLKGLNEYNTTSFIDNKERGHYSFYFIIKDKGNYSLLAYLYDLSDNNNSILEYNSTDLKTLSIGDGFSFTLHSVSLIYDEQLFLILRGNQLLIFIWNPFSLSPLYLQSLYEILPLLYIDSFQVIDLNSPYSNSDDSIESYSLFLSSRTSEAFEFLLQIPYNKKIRKYDTFWFSSSQAQHIYSHFPGCEYPKPMLIGKKDKYMVIGRFCKSFDRETLLLYSRKFVDLEGISKIFNFRPEIWSVRGSLPFFIRDSVYNLAFNDSLESLFVFQEENIKRYEINWDPLCFNLTGAKPDELILNVMNFYSSVQVNLANDIPQRERSILQYIWILVIVLCGIAFLTVVGSVIYCVGLRRKFYRSRREDGFLSEILNRRRSSLIKG